MRGLVQRAPHPGDNGPLSDNEHIEFFFTDLRDTHLSGVGVKEPSYYPYLANLSNVIGENLNRGFAVSFTPGALVQASLTER